MKKNIYFPNLNGVRFFAALSVIIYHFYGISVLNGHLGVILFFVLSGFLITYLLFEEKSVRPISVSKFYIRRVLRIWPLYFFIVIISSIIFFLNDVKSTDYYFRTIPYYLLFVPNLAFVLDKTLMYSGVLWSVGSEEQFYFVWPWLIDKIENKKIVVVFFILIAFFMLAPHIVDYLNYHFINNNRILFYSTKLMERMSFGSMATGGIFAYIAFYKDKYLIYIFSKHLQLFNLVILLTCWILNINFLFNDQFYATLFGILIINFAINPNVLFSLEYKVFNYLGKISYGLYVYHLMAFSINNFIIYFFQIKEIPMIVIFLMGLLLTIFLAAISYEFIEKPFLKIKSNKFTIVKSDR